MAFAVFGPGSLYVTRTDIANQSPVNIGYVQEFSYDESGDVKELFGQNQYPLAIARGTIKATGKIKQAMVSGVALNAVFNGQTLTAGQLRMISQTASIPAPAGPYTITVTNSAAFDTDLGVINATTGLPLTKVASGPTTGQYSVSAGVYTFAAADTGISMTITYAYTIPSTGSKQIIVNTPIGNTPTFQIDFATVYAGSNYYVRMYACVSNKLSRQHKLVDFMMPEIDFGFFANAAQQVYQVSYADAG